MYYFHRKCNWGHGICLLCRGFTVMLKVIVLASHLAIQLQNYNAEETCNNKKKLQYSETLLSGHP